MTDQYDYLRIDHVLMKNKGNEEPFTEEEMHKFLDDFIALVKSHGYFTGGTTELMTEPQVLSLYRSNLGE